MIRFLAIFLACTLELFSLEVLIESDNFDKLFNTLSSQEVVSKLAQEPRISYSHLSSTSKESSQGESINFNQLRKEYAKLKMLLVYLPKDTTKEMLKERLRDALFKEYAPIKEEFRFIYKISYPNSAALDGDALFEKLQKEISLYILQKYGISNIEDEVIIQNLQMKSFTKNYTVGTVEADPLGNFEAPYHYEKESTTRSGVVSFWFYPFVIVKRNQTLIKDTPLDKKDLADIRYKEITSESIQKDDIELDQKSYKQIANFLGNLPNPKRVDVASYVNHISDKILRYDALARELFSHYPECKKLECIDKKIKKKLQSYSVLKKKKLYSYDIDLSNDDEFEYVVFPAFRKLQKYLKRDTQINSLENSQTLKDDSFKDISTESKIVPVIQKVAIQPYIKENEGKIGLHFDVSVSFDETDVCKQYFLGVSKKRLYGMPFVRLKLDDHVIEVSQTEVTNRLFKKIYPSAKREKECQKTTQPDEPVNCLSYATLDEFIKRLNKHSRRYHYRFLSCKEAQTLATCGSKQKYCWGNQKDYKEYEFIRRSRYDATIKKVATKKANALGLYDLCGNLYEYCVDKKGWYETFGSDPFKLTPRIFRHSYIDVSGIRLARELR
ncbi:hypothetical protein MNB_SM-7-1385 [hydrothermal vent metagenome]|uniref:Sulfatase-modifying factor enzyme-like domain-containing protein n=1 Tax=hydrothermal vent metagenome TaxID=652676 RepID=A0A1W1BYU6_9ZZZZ